MPKNIIHKLILQAPEHYPMAFSMSTKCCLINMQKLDADCVIIEADKENLPLIFDTNWII